MKGGVEYILAFEHFDKTRLHWLRDLLEGIKILHKQPDRSYRLYRVMTPDPTLFILKQRYTRAATPRSGYISLLRT
jgi:hypothetical protein